MVTNPVDPLTYLAGKSPDCPGAGDRIGNSAGHGPPRNQLSMHAHRPAQYSRLVIGGHGRALFQYGAPLKSPV